jgi:hypothetical protein
MKLFARWLYMRHYRAELLAIANDLRSMKFKPEYGMGTIDTLERLDLLTNNKWRQS